MTPPGSAGAPPPRGTGTFLTDMVREVRRELQEGYYRERPPAPERRAGQPPSLERALARTDLTEPPRLIVELKRVSPGYGGSPLPDVDPATFVRNAETGGASALSVIPQPYAFHGRLEDLGEVARRSRLPVLFKDFILDPIQLQAASAWGASAVLLIARLETERLFPAGASLAGLVRAARELGLESLVEVHHASEVSLALGSGATLMGVNSRDLQSLKIDLEAARPVIRQLSSHGAPVVAMSGVEGATEVRQYAAAGAGAVLVGTSVARSSDPVAYLQSLRSRSPG